MNDDGHPLECKDNVIFRYRGPSMRSTFTPGEILHTQPSIKGIHSGDVVIYRRGEGFIVHRVVSVFPEGVQTRGDDNRQEDGFVRFEDVIGVVKGVETSRGMQPAVGGFWGHQLARLRWGWRSILNWMRPWLGFPYRWMKTSRMVTHVWHPRISQIQVQIGSSVVIKYMARGKVVATWDPDHSRFTCRQPYDLVIFPPKSST